MPITYLPYNTQTSTLRVYISLFLASGKRDCGKQTGYASFPGLVCDRPLALADESSIDQRHRVALAGRCHFHGDFQVGIVFVVSPVWQTPCRPTLQPGETPKSLR